MIRGTVVGIQARVFLRVQDRAKRYHAIEAIVDTDFDGWLSLPSPLAG